MYKERAEFHGFSITPAEYDAILDFTREQGIHRVLEFGPGASTWSFLEAGCEIVSLEYQEKWFEHYRQVFADFPNVRMLRYENLPELEIPELNGERFDMGFVDSPVGRLGGHYKRFARLNACEFTASKTDVWMLHDANRGGERDTLSVFEEKEWSIESIHGAPKLAVVHRGGALRRKLIGSGPSPSRQGRRVYDLSHWPKLPRVSCQCITYGRPELLNEAVESFLRQDYAGEKELIILNDHAGILIEEFDHPDVHVINIGKRFCSIGEKRNACCGLCAGEVIFPWDDDDISLPWRVSVTLEGMKNRHYFRPNRFLYWANCRMSVKESFAHSMGAWSRELFDEVRGYPHIQSGQDQAIEGLFGKTGKRTVGPIPDKDLFYIYRFPGTGSYHLSAHGFGNGFAEAEKFVNKHVTPGRYTIIPKWAHDYVALAGNVVHE